MIFYNHFETCWLDIYSTSDHVKGWQFDKITKYSFCTFRGFTLHINRVPTTYMNYLCYSGIFHQWAKTKSICVNSYPSYCPHCYIFSVRLSRIESYSQITLSISFSLSLSLHLHIFTLKPTCRPNFYSFLFSIFL